MSVASVYLSEFRLFRIIFFRSPHLDFAIEGIKQMDPATFEEIKESGPFKVTRLGWINKALEHVVHHRGQCAVYLRLSGVTPPQYQLF